MRRNIYQGPESCWAIHEHIYVPGHGIDAKSAEGILALMDRELRRGWTYDHRCRRIKMTPALAVKRANYLKVLAKQKGSKEAEKVAEIVDEWLERHGLLRKAKKKAMAYA